MVFHSGKLCTYRFCDNVWTFVLKDVDMRVGHSELGSFPAVKIVACDAKAAVVVPANTANAEAKADKNKEASTSKDN